MGKRSDKPRRLADSYLTIDPRAVRALLPYLEPGTEFAEPCAGEGHLIASLLEAGHVCTHASDLRDGTNALDLPPLGLVITNPPWTRDLLHALICHWLVGGGCWLLFDSDWACTAQARPLLPFCTDIVPIGRLRWIENTKMQSKDSCAWYRFAMDGDGLGPRVRVDRAV